MDSCPEDVVRAVLSFSDCDGLVRAQRTSKALCDAVQATADAAASRLLSGAAVEGTRQLLWLKQLDVGARAGRVALGRHHRGLESAFVISRSGGLYSLGRGKAIGWRGPWAARKHAACRARCSPQRVGRLEAVRIAAVASGCCTALATGAYGGAWAWGNNCFGQLGLGDTANRLLPTAISAFQGRVVASVATCGFRAVATCGGELYEWGLAWAGPDRAVPFSQEMTRFTSPAVVRIARPRRGVYKLAAFVKRLLGKLPPLLGAPHAGAAPARAAPRSSRRPCFSTVSLGRFCATAVDAQGGLWCWGNAPTFPRRRGRHLGVVPARLTGLGPVVQASAGLDHCLALTAAGCVYVFGRNYLNQVRPARVETEVRMASVYAGSSTSFAVSEAGELWGWRARVCGQLLLHVAVSGETAPARVGAFRGTNVTCLAGIEGYIAIAQPTGRDTEHFYAWGDIAPRDLDLTDDDESPDTRRNSTRRHLPPTTFHLPEA